MAKNKAETSAAHALVSVDLELAQVAEQAELLYINGDEPGYTRRRQGRGFSYFDAAGERVTDEALRERFAALVIPPAWQEVWICSDDCGHILATGRDEKGRKQYIYHPRWEEARNTAKFNRLIPFAEMLPRLRERLDGDLRKHGLSRRKVIAIAVSLMEETFIRIGNEEYASRNSTYGLTTLEDDHVEVHGSQITLDFVGKSGKEHEIHLRNRRLARLMQRVEDLPGQRLFQYEDEAGTLRPIGSGDVNAYIHEAMDGPFSAKDFRTWGGTVLATAALHSLGPSDGEQETKRNIVQAIKQVAERLGNTPAVCRQYYVHPVILESYADNSLFASVLTVQESDFVETKYGLDLVETAVLNMLREGLPT